MLSKKLLRRVNTTTQLHYSNVAATSNIVYNKLQYRNLSSSSKSSPVPSETHTPATSNKITSHHSMSQHLPAALGISSDIVVDHAKGSYLYTTDGRKVLDFTCGIGVTNLGHCHEKVNNAAIEQINKGVHLQVNCNMSQPVLQLADKITSKLPKKLDQVVFSNTGAEAVENAIKLARHATHKTNIITFQGSFHGRTLATGMLHIYCTYSVV